MTTHNLARTVARDAAQLAGKLCLAVRAGMLRNPTYMEKAGKEPVTIADYGAQAVILHHIAQRFPDDCTLAEERAAEFLELATASQQHQVVHYVGEALGHHVSISDVARWLDFGCSSPLDRVWVVDPIDGTKGFLRGEQFAVAVALIVNGEPLVGALACPLLPFDPAEPDNTGGVIAVAVKGQGATIEPLNGGYARPLHVSDVSDIRRARVVESVEPGHTDHEYNERVLAHSGVGGEIVRIDSQAKYVVVADGRAEIYIRHSGHADYREKVWDHAAGYLIVQEAGGQVTDLDGRSLDFSQGLRLNNNRGVLATNGAVHGALLETIKHEPENR
ncbi:MAG: 3'(2'),5'-bisphosphate nucleotidase [Anaerolineae bacterium]